MAPRGVEPACSWRVGRSRGRHGLASQITSATIRIRIDPRRRAAGDKVLRRLGLTPAQAVNLLYAQIEARRGLPFAVTLSPDEWEHVPNETTVAALREDVSGRPRFKSVDELFENLNRWRIGSHSELFHR